MSNFETNYRRWHTITSFIKSGIRIIACGAAMLTGSIMILGAGLLVAEIVGILEEWI